MESIRLWREVSHKFSPKPSALKARVNEACSQKAGALSSDLNLYQPMKPEKSTRSIKGPHRQAPAIHVQPAAVFAGPVVGHLYGSELILWFPCAAIFADPDLGKLRAQTEPTSKKLSLQIPTSGQGWNASSVIKTPRFLL